MAAVQTVSQVIDTLLPYVGGSSVKDAVLHLSQQAETFYFSRAPKGLGWDVEPFWASVESWTDGFGGAHRPPDYLYDRTLTRQGLAGYRLLLMPMSLALSEAQARTVIAFVQGGGTLLLGIGVGHCDEWGEPRPTNPLGEAFGFAWERIPSPEADEIEAVTLVPAEGGEALNVLGLHAPFRLRGDEWQVLYRHGTTPDAAPAIATRSFGKGRVLLIDTDLGAAPAGWQAVYGGDTRIAVTDERARQGRQALKLVDGPRAEHSFFPDVEMNFSRVALPRYPGLRFACDLWMEPRAAVSIELRQRHNGVRLGPSLHFAGGKVKTHAGELGRRSRGTVGPRRDRRALCRDDWRRVRPHPGRGRRPPWALHRPALHPLQLQRLQLGGAIRRRRGERHLLRGQPAPRARGCRRPAHRGPG